ncbi:MAG: PilN domain-containing protein [Dehalococcoidia bacterium]|jgi:Tfp pilus assembly protein PilN
MLTFNIEDDTIKYTVFKGRRITFASEVPLTSGWVQDGVIIERSAVGQQIATTLRENRINDKDVIACVSATRSIYRVVFAPKLERTLMAEAASKEMEHISPVPLDTLYTSWQDVAISDVEIGLCLLGLPHDNVDSVIDTITLAGLRVKSLELKPLAVSRVVDEATAIVVNIQSNGFDITILQDGIPELIRSLTFPQASMPDADKGALVSEELTRTVNFHNSSHAERQLGKNTACFFSGNVQGEVLQNTGYVVKPLPALLSYPAGADLGRFAANTGLMLKEAGGKSRLMKVDINTMPGMGSVAKAAAGRPIAAPLIALITGCLIVIVAFILSSVANKEVSDLRTMVNQQQKLVTDTQTTITQQSSQGANQLDQYRQTLNSLKGPLDSLSQQREYSKRDLGTITSALPAIINLTTLTDDGKSLTVEGTAPSSDSILNYARDLRLSGNFESITISSIESQDYSDFNFTIDLAYKR